MIGGSSYQIDLACLTQTNVGTRRIRPIRRQLITQDAENHRALIKIEHLEVDLDRVREQLAVEEAKRKSAETALVQMEQRLRQAEGRMEPLCENVDALRRQMEAWRLKDSCGRPSASEVMLDEGLRRAAERALRLTVHDNDADCAKMKSASVLRVEANCNPRLWKDYERSKERIRQSGRDILG
jgi:hypothetical protein